MTPNRQQAPAPNRQQAPPTGEIEVGTVTCGCRNGNLTEAIGIQRALVERAMARDPEAVGELYDRYVDDVYGYLLAWARDPETAEQLTERVFRDVMTWLPVVARGEGELGAWLIAMARDAVAHGRGPRPPEAEEGIVGDVALLDDPEREVVILRLLLGHSLVHTAHLTGYRPRVTKALQLLACSTLWERSQESPVSRAARTGSVARDDGEPYYLDAAQSDRRRADEFERRLNRWGADLTDDDRGLANALAIASSLRMEAPAVVTAPDPAFVYRVREELVADAAAKDPEAPAEAPVHASRFRRHAAPRTKPPRWAALLELASRRVVLLAAAGAVLAAVAGFMVIASLAGPPSRCGAAGCLGTATTGAGSSAAGAGTAPPGPTGAGAPASSGPGATTTTPPAPNAGGQLPPRTTARGAAVPPPTGAPGTTARPPATTLPPPTTRHQPPTTAKPPPTTAPTTTPTTAPPPTTGPTTTGVLPPLP